MKYWLISFSLLFTLLPMTQVSAYGWGYEQQSQELPPQIGKYNELIKNHRAYYLDDSGEKTIYLTFDNGYEAGYTEQILDVLKKHQVPALFFVTGHYVESANDIVKRIVAEGHQIGNHSDSHPDFTTLTKTAMKKELDTLEKAVANITTQTNTVYLRPPRGTFDENTLKWADELGYIHIFWSLAYNDWNTDQQKGAQYAYDNIMKQIHPGAIILLHSVSKDNADALEKVIVALKQSGYQFKDLDELISNKLLSTAPVL